MPLLTTLLSLPPSPGIELICARAEAAGASATREAEGASIRTAGGIITLRARGEAISLSVSTATDLEMGQLREAIEELASQSGLPPLVWAGDTITDAGKSRLIAARLVSKQRISPFYCRIRLAGDFSVFAKGGLHFRLLIGPEGASLPAAGPEGIEWPGGIDCWHRPPYTVRRIDPEGGWLDFDIFLHEGGRVTEWCEEITQDSPVMLTGPGGRGVKQAGWMGIIGDETALPVVLRAIEAAPATARGEAMILIADPGDIQPVETPPGLALRWILRSEGKSLSDLLHGLRPPATDRFVFFAGERAEAEAARAHAKAIGLSGGEFHAAAYWTAGWEPPSSQRQAKGLPLSPAGAAGRPAAR